MSTSSFLPFLTNCEIVGILLLFLIYYLFLFYLLSVNYNALSSPLPPDVDGSKRAFRGAKVQTSAQNTIINIREKGYICQLLTRYNLSLDYFHNPLRFSLANIERSSTRLLIWNFYSSVVSFILADVVLERQKQSFCVFWSQNYSAVDTWFWYSRQHSCEVENEVRA